MQQFLDSWFSASCDGKMPELAAVSQDTRIYWHSLVTQVKARNLESWKRTPPGRLSLIILMGPVARLLSDTQSRQLHHKAKQLCIHGVELGFDTQLDIMQRRYFYDPLFSSDTESERALLQRLLTGMRAHTTEDSLNVWQTWYHQSRMPAMHTLAV